MLFLAGEVDRTSSFVALESGHISTDTFYRPEVTYGYSMIDLKIKVLFGFINDFRNPEANCHYF